MANLTYENGKYYGSPNINIMGKPLFGAGYFQNDKMLNSAIKGGWINELGSPAGTPQQTFIGASQRQPFVANQFTQGQLGGMNNASAPQWMMDAYINKIGSMGGNANAPIPFQVNQSGFPGMGGKTAPTQG
jgi:hypothetical protein